jgi:transposase
VRSFRPTHHTDEIVNGAKAEGVGVVIPPKRNRKVQREYDKGLYIYQHLVENAFMHLKRWRGVATRYAKNSASFLAAVQIRCIALWANIS